MIVPWWPPPTTIASYVASAIAQLPPRLFCVSAEFGGLSRMLLGHLLTLAALLFAPARARRQVVLVCHDPRGRLSRGCGRRLRAVGRRAVARGRGLSSRRAVA